MYKKEEKDEKEEGKRKYMKEKIAMQKTMYY